MRSPTVFDMVNQVLEDANTKIHSDSSGVEKTAAAVEPGDQMSTEMIGELSVEELQKTAEACFYLADHLTDVVDDRQPAEKLAELAEIHEALMGKMAEGDIDPDKKHQTQEAPAEFQSPKAVTLDGSGTGVGGTNAVPSKQTDIPGTSMDAGESGGAKTVHQSPKSVTPSEKPNPQDAANALDTNKEMMMPEQPEDVLKQAGLSPQLMARAQAVKASQNPSKPGAETVTGETLKRKKASIIVKKARAAGIRARLEKAASESAVPPNIAKAIIEKIAEDALNPAQISAGTEPVLQSEPGVPSALMQGSEAGSNTPRETAPTTGEAKGREFISDNEVPVNTTKQQAKTQNVRAAMGQLLTEQALSSTGDKTLQQSLDNTSSAGVKISAAKELIRKFAAASPENALLVSALAEKAKRAMIDAPSEEALEAVKAGVTPEELSVAEQILSAQGEEAAAADAAAAEAAPEMGEMTEEGAEKAGQPPMGGMPTPAASAPPGASPAAMGGAAAPAGGMMPPPTV